MTDSPRLVWARTFRERLVGLLASESISPGFALGLRPCACVHTFGMRFPIDVAFVDRDDVVLRLFVAVSPWRIVGCPGAAAAIELAAGAAAHWGVIAGRRFPQPPSGP